MDQLENDIIIYTDGAFANSKNVGGYAFAIYNKGILTHRYFQKEIDTTNQRTEVLAVIAVFRYLLTLDIIPDVTIITDSMYVVGISTLNWNIKANKDLWKIYFCLYDQIKDKITFKHVRGHQGNEGNNVVDVLAVLASNSL